MKSIRITALALTLLAASVGTWAHMAHEPDGSGLPGQPPVHAMQGLMHRPMQHQTGMGASEMRTLQAEMREKMAAAKTPEERQALMTQQHEKMHGSGIKPDMPGLMSPR